MAQYHELGYAKVENVLHPQELAALREVCDEFLEMSRSATTHTDVFDLEPGHTAEPMLVEGLSGSWSERWWRAGNIECTTSIGIQCKNVSDSLP